MRNLRIINQSDSDFKIALNLEATAFETETNSLLCAFGPTEENQVIELRKCKTSSEQGGSESTLIASWDALCPLPDLKCDKILSFRHLAASDTICLVLAGGDIIIVRAHPLEHEEKIEIVGSIDAGITAAEWSPDEELLAVTTRENTLLFMSGTFENVANAKFTVEDSRLSKHVSVGWGKSETQFKGKRANALRDPTIPERVDQGILSSHDQGQVSMSWRGDGMYVAINTVEDMSRRMVRVFTREGTLDSVTEPVDGLEGSLSWRPAGNLIAGVQRLEDTVNIVFFERNGLRHGDFPLRLTPADMATWASCIDLRWNLNSSVLAISFRDRIQLWTMSNYHYYLKQELHFSDPAGSEQSLTILWHSEQALRLAVSGTKSHISGRRNGVDSPLIDSHSSVSLIEFTFCVATGSSVQPYDFGTVAVVDGTILKMTPLRRANIPPPMALHEVELKGNITDAAMNLKNTKVAVLLQKSVVVMKYDPGSLPVHDLMDEMLIDLPLTDHHVARQICFLGDEQIFILYSNLETGIDVVLDVQRLLFFGIENAPTLLRLLPSTDHQSLCAVGRHAVFTIDAQLVPTENPRLPLTSGERIASLPAPTPWVELVHYKDETMAFILTAGGSLYANERLLLRNATSFAVTTSHVIITTSTHFLKFIHLTSVEDLEVPPDSPEEDERCRNLERGARIIAVMPTSFSVVLQMPRGNLETIYPRALVLAGIRKSVAARDYLTAFLACRNRRVDLNILHDVAPGQFLNDTAVFIAQVKQTDYIDLFLSSLKEEDVTQTMYKETASKQQHVNCFAPRAGAQGIDHPQDTVTRYDGSKVNRICRSFLETLQDQMSSHMQNAITAYVCQVPPNIEAALVLITELHKEDVDLADAAIEHICFIVDVNQVYECALGLYDLDLALLVAQKSQKDPREYLPYLQELQEMSVLRRKHTIDDQLRRHAKALAHLHTPETAQEFHAYYEKHVLYAQALELCRYESRLQAEVKRNYAEHLSMESRFEEAAIAFESLGDYAAASSSYRSANLWQESLSSATLIPLPSSSLSALARSLAESLAESKDHTAAAIIHTDYLADIPAAIKHFCKAHDFAAALRVAGLHNRPELLEEIIDPGLVEAAAALTELLAECKAQLNAQVPRLRELRAAKAKDPLAFLTGDATGEAGRDIPDDISLAPSSTATTTNASLYTRYTGLSSTGQTTSSRKTSKNRRREERKRARGKKGSVYEEEYLVNSFGRLVERFHEAQGELEKTVKGLLRRAMWERARGLESLVGDVWNALRASVEEVYEAVEDGWGASGGARKENEEEKEEEEGRGLGGGERVLLESMRDAGQKRSAPIVKVYQRSSLLGA